MRPKRSTGPTAKAAQPASFAPHRRQCPGDRRHPINAITGQLRNRLSLNPCGDSVSRMIEQRPFSGYELLGHRPFRALWTANLVSNLGSVIFLLASAWVMTSITERPLMVALVQTAVSLPFLFLSIPFGILGDLFGHRRLLLVAHAWMLLPAGALALIAWRGQLTSWLLLSLLALTGVGVVIQQSSWKPLLCDLVPREKNGCCALAQLPGQQTWPGHRTDHRRIPYGVCRCCNCFCGQSVLACHHDPCSAACAEPRCSRIRRGTVIPRPESIPSRRIELPARIARRSRVPDSLRHLHGSMRRHGGASAASLSFRAISILKFGRFGR